ncbi:MAG: thiamine biosynthesis lipoprotein [Sphingobacteriales bacterium]|jgi:thiamine biosynthesis lipoprotein
MRLVALLLFSIIQNLLIAQKVIKQGTTKMGCAFEITAVATDSLVGISSISQAYAEIDRIENEISSWKKTSKTSEINENAGIKPIKVSFELFQLVQRAIKIANLTDGAFDISIGKSHKKYIFDGRTLAKLDSSIKDSCIGYKGIILNEMDTSIYLRDSCMQLDFGGIGKGFAAMKSKVLLENSVGVSGGVVNASGDLVVFGEAQNKLGWEVQIVDPENTNKFIAYMLVNNTAVITSGNYEKYFMFEDKRYSHILNPITKIPTTGIKSVTVVCVDAELADALATSIFVLGEKKGMELVNKLNGVEALLVNDENELIQSKNLSLSYY